MYKFVTYAVAGTSFDWNGKSRQKELVKIKRRTAPYDKEARVELRPGTYKGEETSEVWVNDFMIGHIKKKDLPQLERDADFIDTITAFDVVGGGRDDDGERINYGVRLTIRYNFPDEEDNSPNKEPKPEQKIENISTKTQNQMAAANKAVHYSNIVILTCTVIVSVCIGVFLFYALIRPHKQLTERDNVKTAIQLCVQDKYDNSTNLRWAIDEDWHIVATDVEVGTIYEVETYFGIQGAYGDIVKHPLTATAYRDDNAKEWGVSSMAIDAQSVFG